MKKLSFLLMGMIVFVWTACSSDTPSLPNDYIETTQTGSSQMVLKGYASGEISLFQPTEFSSFLYIQNRAFAGAKYSFVPSLAKRLDAMTDLPGDNEWKTTAAISEGATYWARCSEELFYRYLKLRVAYIDGNNVGIEYVISDVTTTRPNINSNYDYLNQHPTVGGVEIPRLKPDAYTYVAHSVTYKNQKFVNLVLEWDAGLRHSRWVAFSFDAITSENNVDRTDEWAWDPLISAANGGVEESDHKSDGFDKGHLCASGDRTYSAEANKQTFYYSNISPQLNQLNAGFWQKLENKVRAWGRATVTGTYDKVYVVKGGTLNRLLKSYVGREQGYDGQYPKTDADGLTIHGLACPAYYYMALLAETSGDYQAIAFLVEHTTDLPLEPTAAELQEKVLTVDELEEFTNIDFFCNLPDDVESAVESTVDINLWAW